MITATKVPVAAIRPSIVFLDSENKVTKSFIDSFSNKLNGGTVSVRHSLPEKVASFDYLFLYTEGYDRNSAEALAFLCDEVKNAGIPLLLIHENILDKELFPFLSFPLNGIVSLSYFQEHSHIVFQQIAEKGVFLEPWMHRDLVKEIERKKLKDTPIKKLVLNRDIVTSLLTENEQDVLQLILDGLNNRRIAETLFLAPSTVSTIISHLLRKIQANDRTDAMVKAIRNGWVEAYR